MTDHIGEDTKCCCEKTCYQPPYCRFLNIVFLNRVLNGSDYSTHDYA